MRAESILFAVAGAFFGLLVGWVIGTQSSPAGTAAPAAVQAPAQPPRPMLDETQARALEVVAEREPKSAAPRVQLGNLYYDAERFTDAIRWYEEALAIEPGDANVSTDLGVAYYYTNQTDRALQQFEKSLKIDPKHTKTLLNLGVVRAFGRQDLEGAASAWQQVVDSAPGSPEAEAARRALDSLKAAHPEMIRQQPGDNGTR
jgi:cytochrome c-type biogenesis protein CcmH/NrfG